jgi:hypothetical protein
VKEIRHSITAVNKNRKGAFSPYYGLKPGPASMTVGKNENFFFHGMFIITGLPWR